MKALTYHGSHDVRVEEVPDPTIVQNDDIILRVTATAICGSDLHLYRGKMPALKDGDILGQVPRRMPAHPGHLRGRAIGTLDPMRARIDDQQLRRIPTADQGHVGRDSLAMGGGQGVAIFVDFGPSSHGRVQKLGAHGRIIERHEGHEVTFRIDGRHRSRTTRPAGREQQIST